VEIHSFRSRTRFCNIAYCFPSEKRAGVNFRLKHQTLLSPMLPTDSKGDSSPMKKSSSLIAIIVFPVCVQAQTASQFWSPIDESKIKPCTEWVVLPKKYKTFHLANDHLKDVLWSAPDEKQVKLQDSKVIVEIPLPDGTMQKYRVVYSPVMAREMAAKFPDIKTFDLMAVDKSGSYGKADWTDRGFHAMIGRKGIYIYIDPFCLKNTTDYISHIRSDDDPAVKLSPHWTM
jgi:hypothetical protein